MSRDFRFEPPTIQELEDMATAYIFDDCDHDCDNCEWDCDLEEEYE